ncbi:hypothetical protein HFK74_08345|uniref:hypothetical protein n=1 Tax=Pseudomonas sp. SbOxS1 TaxID=2723884 RepID=UPI0015D27804|nr:hypothetical protein [Pseudomonas sp. SbOxS1]NYU02703.1 hypothetical protein [Pseudomonas sp. SbOxS1]
MSNQSSTMSQMNLMSKLPNGSRVISYMFGSYPMRRCSLHFLFLGGRYLQCRITAIIASSSIAVDYVDYHLMNSRIQA